MLHAALLYHALADVEFVTLYNTVQHLYNNCPGARSIPPETISKGVVTVLHFDAWPSLPDTARRAAVIFVVVVAAHVSKSEYTVKKPLVFPFSEFRLVRQSLSVAS